MPNTRKPRSGSLQFWPRKRSKRKSARIRTYVESKDPKLSGFAGYKVGMTHLQAIETNKNSHKKGEQVSVPVTIIECPPIRIAALRAYVKDGTKIVLKKEILVGNNKTLSKRLKLLKKDSSSQIDKLNAEELFDIRVLVYTQPGLLGINKKTPDMIELGLGGSIQDKLSYVKENIGKDITVDTIFEEGDLLDAKGITKGKGFQGPVKRFGISVRAKKSEKAIRNPGSLGPWKAQGHIMWRVAHAGKMGYHQRTEYNKQILKITEGKELNTNAGFLKYGKLKNKVILVKGGIAGSRKRLVVFQKSLRSHRKPQIPTIEKIDLTNKQGN